MRAESDVMPSLSFTIDKRGELADVTFFENVQEVQTEEGAVFEYDTHTLTVPYHNDLDSAISLDYNVWLAAAKDNEIDKVAPPTIDERLESVEEAVADLTIQSFGL